MANVDRPSGLRPIGTLSGADWNSKVREYEVDANTAVAIGVGQLVVMEAGGNLEATAAADSAVSLGVVVGIVPTGNVDPDNFLTTGNLGEEIYPGYIPATTAGKVLVAVGPDILYEIQADSATVITAAARGSRCNIVGNTINVATGRAITELDGSEIDATAAHQMQIHDYVRSPDNDITLIHSKWIVSLNQYQNALASAGI